MQPLELREFDAMVRAARWSALTPTLPFSGLAKDRPPIASPLFGAVALEAYQLVPLLRALEMPIVTLMLADTVGVGKTIQATPDPGPRKSGMTFGYEPEDWSNDSSNLADSASEEIVSGDIVCRKRLGGPLRYYNRKSA